MKVSAKTEYACLAMLDLAASHGRGEPVRIRDIADHHGIPSRFLVQILLQLKGAGMVNSTRGASGGYQLSREPEEVSLADVVSVIEGPREVATAAAAGSPVAKVLAGVWNEISAAEDAHLREITLADLVDRAADQTRDMYYI
ncbi:MAG: Rrf2 family transcriptional regulator [Pirellulales bacterium]|nr:Rrf2 family transcriptional regulator [Pirellulales bacterium]